MSGTEPPTQQHEPADLSGEINRISYSNIAVASATGRRSTTSPLVNKGSLFQRQGKAQRKEQSVIF